MKRWIVQPGGRSMWTAPDWVLGRGRAPPSSAKYRTTSAGDGRRTPEWPVLIRVIHHWRRRRRCRNPPCLTGTVWPSSSAPAEWLLEPADQRRPWWRHLQSLVRNFLFFPFLFFIIANFEKIWQFLTIFGNFDHFWVFATGGDSNLVRIRNSTLGQSAPSLTATACTVRFKLNWTEIKKKLA